MSWFNLIHPSLNSIRVRWRTWRSNWLVEIWTAWKHAATVSTTAALVECHLVTACCTLLIDWHFEFVEFRVLERICVCRLLVAGGCKGEEVC
jgi:hypothetical protein